MDCLIGLPDEERIKLAKKSKRSLEFIERTLRHALYKPKYVHKIMTLERYQEIVELIKRLRRINATVTAFHQKITDTLIAAEEEAYAMARMYYKSARDAAKEGDAEAERIYQDLAYQFKTKRTSKKDEKETPNTTEEEK